MTTTLLQEEIPAVQAGAHSPLNQAFSAAIREYITSDGGSAYSKLYMDQVGQKVLFVPKCDDCGSWPDVSGLGRDVLRLGYVIDDSTAPYVRDLGGGNLTGFDVQLAKELVRRINAHYSLSMTISWFVAPAVGLGATPLSRLYQGLLDHSYDVAFCGQMILPASDLPPGVDPDWTCASALIGPAITYTGKGGLDLKPMTGGKTRDDFIAYMAATYPTQTLVYFSVINPGPSTPAATALVGDLHLAGCEAYWTGGTVEESAAVMLAGKYAFAVGDCIASAWQSRQSGFAGVYLGIPAGKGTPSVQDGTLVQVAPFTLKA